MITKEKYRATDKKVKATNDSFNITGNSFNEIFYPFNITGDSFNEISYPLPSIFDKILKSFCRLTPYYKLINCFFIY